MCVVSMVMDHQWDEWNRRYPRPFQPPVINPFAPLPIPAPVPVLPPPTPEEIAEFRRLLERAREYDRRNNEPDCELAEKRQRLKDLAKELGVAIDFV
jgi:hypothetical protein